MISRYILCVCIMAAGIFQSVAQQTEEIIKHPLQQVEPLGVFEPLKVTEDWAYGLRNTEKVHAHGSDEELKLQEASTERFKRLLADPNRPATRSSTVDAPRLLNGFQGNRYSGQIPNDNDIAISKGGFIVSVTNTLVDIYNVNGQRLSSSSLTVFGGNVTTNGVIHYDPRVIYDPNADRFIVLFLEGDVSSTSQVVVAYSRTNDPTQGWNVYGFRTDEANLWTDYPHVGISNDELFITGNLFLDTVPPTGSRARGVIVWQASLQDGYDGNTITLQKYTLPGIFTLLPVRGSNLTTYGPEFYFVRKNSNRAFFQNDIFLYRITNTIANGGVFDQPFRLVSNLGYASPPLCRQPNTTDELVPGDGRPQSAYLLGDKIYFAFGTASAAFRPAIYFGRIRLSPASPAFSRVDALYIETDTLDIGFPSITYGGCSNAAQDEHSTVVAFNLTSDQVFSGFGVAVVDTNFEASSIQICAEGLNFTDIIPRGNGIRWGDYTGIATRFPGETWAVGYRINQRRQNETWISQLLTPRCNPPSQTPTSIEEETSAITNMQIFPNPTFEMVYFDFDVPRSGRYYASIVDAGGKTVKELVNTRLAEGKAKLSFNAEPLANGMYMIMIKGPRNTLTTKKFMVQH